MTPTLTIADWLEFWRETGQSAPIARELSADVPRLRFLRQKYLRRAPLEAYEIESVMRAAASVSRASGVSISELVRLADAHLGRQEGR